jgi:hypothetical protein
MKQTSRKRLNYGNELFDGWDALNQIFVPQLSGLVPT